MKINLNQRATVTLTQLGADIWNANRPRANVRAQAGDKKTDQLWEIARIFGPFLIVGCVMPIDPNIELHD